MLLDKLLSPRQSVTSAHWEIMADSVNIDVWQQRSLYGILGQPLTQTFQSAHSQTLAFPVHADIMLSFEVLHQVVLDDPQECLPDNETEGILQNLYEGLDAVDQHETQLVKQLGESLPGLKSIAQKFIELSDSSSKTEGEFVQQVFEPEVRDKIGKSVQELASEADHGAREYRRNIKTALKDSYKQAILIVLLGVAGSFVLSAVVSRAVIGPIQELRDAALLLGQSQMDTRIPVHSKDELGELAGSFNVMADSLTKLIGERGQTQDELSKAHERLKNSVGELESRNREAGTLSEMADLLQSCFTLEEASGVIASSAHQLFHGFSGAVLVFSASRNVLEANTTWGRSSPVERVFSPNDCWALRRGRLHHSGSDEGAVRCSHFGAESRLPSLCTPLMAHGETLVFSAL